MLVADRTQIVKALPKYVIKGHASNPVMLDPSAPPTQTVPLRIVLPESAETTKPMAKSATRPWNVRRISATIRLAEVSFREEPTPRIRLKITYPCISDLVFWPPSSS